MRPSPIIDRQPQAASINFWILQVTTRPLGKHLGFVGRVGGWGNQPIWKIWWSNWIISPGRRGEHEQYLKTTTLGSTDIFRIIDDTMFVFFTEKLHTTTISTGWLPQTSSKYGDGFTWWVDPNKNLPNLYRLWTRNLETNLCRWLGFVAVYYFLETKPPFKLRSWWRPNPKLATSLM